MYYRYLVQLRNIKLKIKGVIYKFLSKAFVYPKHLFIKNIFQTRRNTKNKPQKLINKISE